MLDNVVLDVAIGLIFIYCLYSIFATIISEILASLFGLRARKLKYAIKRMLMDDKKSPLGRQLFDGFTKHPLITYMSGGVLSRRPSYISSESFSKIIVDILSGYDFEDTTKSLDKIEKKLEELGKQPNAPKWQSDTIKLISSYVKESGNDINKFKMNIEKWFNDMMDRVSGWYKRQTQSIILLIGFIIALSYNVNTIEIIKRLSKDKTAREQIIQVATNYVKDRQTFVTDSTISKRLDSLVIRADSLFKADIEPVNQIIGLGWRSWGDFKDGFWDNILGCFITALAISLGAPFWFDILSKFIKLRGTGKRINDNQKKDDEKSSDTDKPAG